MEFKGVNLLMRKGFSLDDLVENLQEFYSYPLYIANDKRVYELRKMVNWTKYKEQEVNGRKRYIFTDGKHFFKTFGDKCFQMINSSENSQSEETSHSQILISKKGTVFAFDDYCPDSYVLTKSIFD